MNQSEHDPLIIDSDLHFIIDTETRTITNQNSKKVSLIQYDHNSERYSFDIDRYIEGYDILTCNRIQIHYINTDSTSRSKYIGLYEVTDIHAHPDDDKKACFTWLISGNATHYQGTLSFLISFEYTKGDDILYRWNSGINNVIKIAAGIDNTGFIPELYPDALLKWENWLTSHFDELSKEITNNFNELTKEVTNEIIPREVDERYIERDFATSEEVGLIFSVDSSSVEYIVGIPYEAVTNAEIDNLFK